MGPVHDSSVALSRSKRASNTTCSEQALQVPSLNERLLKEDRMSKINPR